MSNQIMNELDDLYGELKRRDRIGDVNPESNADALLQLMRLFGRYLAEQCEPVTENARTSYRLALPEVARRG